jgi:hypothetical protein
MRGSVLKWAGVVALGMLVTGCATAPAYDYSALKQSRPKSIVVLPPVNHSPDVTASLGVLSQVTMPLAETGYYVLPVAVVDEVFKRNGLDNAADAQAVPVAKLREIFGADAALYIDVQQYGSVYTVVKSAAVVTMDAKLIDLRSGNVLWKGQATASSAEGQSNSGGLVGMLVAAVVNQIVNSLTDRSVQVAGMASQRLLTGGMPNGLLYGPRSPKYGTD